MKHIRQEELNIRHKNHRTTGVDGSIDALLPAILHFLFNVQRMVDGQSIDAVVAQNNVNSAACLSLSGQQKLHKPPLQVALQLR